MPESNEVPHSQSGFPLRTYTPDEIRDCCVTMKEFASLLIKQFLASEGMGPELQASRDLFNSLDRLQSLLP